MNTNKMMTWILSCALIIAGLTACGSDDDYTYSNIDMDAHFLIIPSSTTDPIVYFAGKDNGNLLDHSFMNKLVGNYDENGNEVVGSYVINGDGSFTLEVWQVNATLSFTGQLTNNGDRGTLSDATTGESVGELIKVLDYTNLVGRWFGTLTESVSGVTHDLDITVLDGQFGSVSTNGTSTVGKDYVMDGLALTTNGYVTIFLETSSTVETYSEFRIWGDLSSSGDITNVRFDVDSDTISGTGVLTK